MRPSSAPKRIGTGEDELGELPAHLLGTAQELVLPVDDLPVHRLCDLDEPGLALERHERQPRGFGGLDHGAGQLAEVAAKLDDDTGHSGGRQFGYVLLLDVRASGDRHASREEKLAAPQQVGDVGELCHVDPSDELVEMVPPGEHLRACPAERLELEDLAQRESHGPHFMCKVRMAKYPKCALSAHNSIRTIKGRPRP